MAVNYSAHSAVTDALIGFTGFVGSNLARQHTFGALFNSSNISDIHDQHFDTLVFSGARAVKWWANKNAAEDWEGIQAALQPLATVSVGAGWLSRGYLSW